MSFLGDWRIARVIEDRRAAASGRFTGQACFSADEKGLHYAEHGLLTLGDAAPMEARQSYHWAQDGGTLIIRFPDMRPFHEVPADAATPEARHHCAPDDYHVHYDFRDWPAWRAVWTVRGPRKDYTMTSTYRPDG